MGKNCEITILVYKSCSTNLYKRVFGSIWEWLSTQVYFEKNGAVVLNAVVLYIFAGLCISLIIYFVGVWGLMKFYVIPLIVYHLWMSTFLRANEETKSQNNVICNFPSL